MHNFQQHSGLTKPRERRADPRFPAVDNTAEVGWFCDGILNSAAAQLMDVSRSGLLVLADDAPTDETLLLVRLVEPTPTEWVEADLVEAVKTRFGPYQIRLSFRGTPASDFLTIALSRDEDDF